MRSLCLLKRIGDLNPLAGLADLLVDADIFPYEQIPHFPVSTVHGHKSRMLFGLYQNIEVLVMQGRFHAYEGYPLGQVKEIFKFNKSVGKNTYEVPRLWTVNDVTGKYP